MSLSVAYTQQDTLADVFPLHVGNEWTYNFTEFHYDQLDDIISTDTGVANYSIIDKITGLDSCRWIFKEIRSYKYCSRYSIGPPQESCYNFTDSTTFELVELFNNNHRLYRIETGPDFFASVIPPQLYLSDTTSLFRYRETDSAGLYYSNPPDSTRNALYYFEFQHGTGIIHLRGHTQITGSGDSMENTLISSIIASVDDNDPTGLLPRAFKLEQNYPNPFNPITTIEYHLNRQTIVSLRVYDILGQELITLIDEKQEAGIHHATLDASTLPSGIYFYRLNAEKFSETRKFVVIK